MSNLLSTDSQSEADQVKIGTPEEKEARLLKALSLEKYMPASFLPIKLVSSFSGKNNDVTPPVVPEKPGNFKIGFEVKLLCS